MNVGPRLDFPGSLHHVMSRGAGGERVLQSEIDKGSFLARLDLLSPVMGFRVYAWALMPNHFHLLMEVGEHNLHEVMHRLLGGYSLSYNRRNDRKGHVFMSRFKSILVCKEEYMFELVRYIHLNPLKAGLVRSVSELAEYPWTGHHAMIHGDEHIWHPVKRLLGEYSRDIESGLKAYKAHLSAGIDSEGDSILESGNARIGKRGITKTSGAGADQRRNDYVGGILGSQGFAVGISRLLDNRRRQTRRRGETHTQVEAAVSLACSRFSIDQARIASSAKAGTVSSARRVVARLLSDIGLSRADIARRLNISQSAVTRLFAKELNSEEMTVLEELASAKSICLR